MSISLGLETHIIGMELEVESKGPGVNGLQIEVNDLEFQVEGSNMRPVLLAD